MKTTVKCLFKHTPLSCIVMSKSLRKPEDQDDCKKETLSDQPRLTRVTPTALLGSWVVQLIEDVTSLGTDFETHAKWQGSIEEPAAKDFIARKVQTIKLNERQGTYWNANKCKDVQKLSSSDKQQSTFIHVLGNPLGIPCLSCTALT
jgi:hypothetical protein